MPVDDVLLEAEDKMDKAVAHLAEEFRGVRTGRASSGLVDHIRVEYYGSPTPLRQLANVGTPEPQMILIKPYDPSSLKDIERAILASDPVPPLPSGSFDFIHLKAVQAIYATAWSE